MEGRRLILKDGTVIEDGAAGYAEGFLWLYLTGYTMQMAAAVFFNQSKTGKIVFQYGEMQDEYVGYTTCIRLMDDGDGKISVCMEKANA